MTDSPHTAAKPEGVIVRHRPGPPPALGRLLLLPALGVPAGYYDPLAEQLTKAGLETHTLELRGSGDSPLRAGRGCDFGFRELLDEDIPSALRPLHAAKDGLPVWLAGHSLGGHLAAMSAGRLGFAIDGLVLLACGLPWRGAFDARARLRIDVLRLLIPVCNTVLGYFPGDRLGFGGRQPRRLMREWSRLAYCGRYAAEGIDEDLEAGVAQYAGPVLTLRMTDDPFAPLAACRAVTEKMAHARHSETALDAATLGTRADHYRWARKPDAVTPHLTDWCRAQRP
ncbi:alpha/beta fold hydrolase [Algiphilus sp.]|uniref:alpha/beta hydrolase family protein n=1 Tax=Algiphilus sp. TaxID=1872431 RepID=UPI0025BC311B|nr:alpha/beta fold hydrolase [Algiphilus sp.]MCI5102604.1 alpha/beta fold hydrolase [Algiphilus sp.]MCR9091282.1 alpha/beta fold hydrolase [Pseudomonadota bacterium]